MKTYIFTERERLLLESVLGDTYVTGNPKDSLLLSVLKTRIKQNKPNLVRDMGLMEKIIEKLDLK